MPPWRVGQWANYDVISHGNRWRLEYALVGREKNGKSQLFWLEARRFEQSDSLFVKCLVPSGLNGAAERVLISGNSANSSLLLDGSHLPWGTEGKPLEVSRKRQPAVLENVDTPAGQFSSNRYEHSAGQIWLSSKVPVFGLVRSKSDEVEMVLVAFGQRGATSELKEAPETEVVP